MTLKVTETEMESYLSRVLCTIAKKISISKTDYQILQDHFNGLTIVLDAGIDPSFNPVLRTQGSIRIGTAVKPIDEYGLDADIICELSNIPTSYTQKDVQDLVGSVLRSHPTYKDLLKEPNGGRRCFTIEYSDGTHVDILPCVVDDNYRRNIREAILTPEGYVLSITDKKSNGFLTDTNRDNWKKSNPIGFANLFMEIARLKDIQDKSESLQIRASVEAFPKFEDSYHKHSLQSIVQLFKRHRDVKMGDDEDKPVSILITTLVEKAYALAPYTGLYGTLLYIAEHLPDGISYVNGKPVVTNPVLKEENFADKWIEKPSKQQKFFEWQTSLVNDLRKLSELNMVEGAKFLKEIFGEKVVTRVFASMAQEDHIAVREGSKQMNPETGVFNREVGIPVKPHTFYSSDKGYQLMPPKPRLPLTTQQRALEITYPNSWSIKKGCGFDWFMKIRPSVNSLTYTVKIKVRQNKVPEVQIVDPKPLEKAEGKNMYEHINHPQELQCLCLHLGNDWTPDMKIAYTFVPWASEWLLNYEYWLITGSWEGGGLHRNVYKP